MIALLILATGFVVVGLLGWLIYEFTSLWLHRLDIPTITDIVRPWIDRHPGVARLLGSLVWAFLLWITLHFFRVWP